MASVLRRPLCAIDHELSTTGLADLRSRPCRLDAAQELPERLFGPSRLREHLASTSLSIPARREKVPHFNSGAARLVCRPPGVRCRCGD
jgi:hypothetical protein